MSSNAKLSGKALLLAGGGVGLFCLGIYGLYRLLKPTEKRKVFFSFHFDNDVMRVQQIRNIGAIQGNEPAEAQDWEQAKKTKNGVENWIEKNMQDKDCVVVLIGTETSKRKWVRHEINRAIESSKPIFGVHIHNIKCARNGKSKKGPNPFKSLTDSKGRKLSDFITVYDPPTKDAYAHIKDNLNSWVESAVNNKQH